MLAFQLCLSPAFPSLLWTAHHHFSCTQKNRFQGWVAYSVLHHMMHRSATALVNSLTTSASKGVSPGMHHMLPGTASQGHCVVGLCKRTWVSGSDHPCHDLLRVMLLALFGPEGALPAAAWHWWQSWCHMWHMWRGCAEWGEGGEIQSVSASYGCLRWGCC